MTRVVTQDKHIAPPPDFATRLATLERLLQGITNLSGDASGQLPNVQVNTVGGGEVLLFASNNLNDVASKSTSVTNLGAAFGGLGLNGYAGAGDALTNVAAGSYAVTPAVPITVVNPNGAYVRLAGGMSAYASAAGTIIDQYYQLDGGTWLLTTNHIGRYYFNAINDHRWCGSFDLAIGPLAAGAHSVQLNIATSAGNVTRDANDWAQIAAYELP